MPKTTIWKLTSNGQSLIKTLSGIPSPIPKQGEEVYNNEFGKTICTGLSCSGSQNTVVEVRLMVQ